MGRLCRYRWRGTEVWHNSKKTRKDDDECLKVWEAAKKGSVRNY